VEKAAASTLTGALVKGAISAISGSKSATVPVLASTGTSTGSGAGTGTAGSDLASLPWTGILLGAAALFILADS
jgi:hypothetical protein